MRHAVILAAGFGSRLARHDGDTPKPLRNVAGQPLLRRNILMLNAAGYDKVVVVVGYCGDQIKRSLAEDPVVQEARIQVEFADNPEYDKSNGLSVLAAEPYLPRAPFLLLMADHIFELDIFRQMSTCYIPEGGAVLGVDRKIEQVFDLDDATKVFTHNNQIQAIGKQLTDYNAIDVGMFSCRPQLFDALRQARDLNGGDCSLSEGITELCRTGRMITHDIGEAFWQDVDDDQMLHHVESVLAQVPLQTLGQPRQSTRPSQPQCYPRALRA